MDDNANHEDTENDNDQDEAAPASLEHIDDGQPASPDDPAPGRADAEAAARPKQGRAPAITNRRAARRERKRRRR